MLNLVSLLFFLAYKTEEWVHAPVFTKKSKIQTRWILLEKTKRWQNHAWGPYETEGSRHGGNWLFRIYIFLFHLFFTILNSFCQIFFYSWLVVGGLRLVLEVVYIVCIPRWLQPSKITNDEWWCTFRINNEFIDFWISTFPNSHIVEIESK